MDLRQKLINILWKYDALHEQEIIQIVNEIMREINNK